ncbi:hypothetical protein [Caballeronia sp. GACF4]|uniref:hypothetical protein n=1 Tax=Caballeronia sp. GACF4 TaxID=2921763 RepID=UPI00202891B0|nr:hypothetical protein [Caballeronia sp. GACF4]
MLKKADRDIAAARRRIRNQEGLLATLEQDGRDTAHARELLGVFRETLQMMVEHCQLIVEQVERLNRRDRVQ